MDFELIITIEDETKVSARRSDDQSIARGELEYDDLRRQTIQIFQDWLNRGRITRRRELEVLGTHLFRTVFNDNKILSKYQEALRQVEGDQRLRIQLCFEEQAAALASWPWEFLYYNLPGSETYFFAVRNKLVLSRFIDLNISRDNLVPEDEPVRILVVSVKPSRNNDTEEAELGLESVATRPVATREVVKVIEELKEKHAVTIEKMEQPTAYEFSRKVEAFEPHILHFIGHGQYHRGKNNSLISFMEADKKTVNWVEDTYFAEYFDLVKPRLVFLHLCEGGTTEYDTFYETFSGLAPKLIKKGILAVVAMQYPISNNDAKTFCLEFYGKLMENAPVDYAVQSGRANITRRDNTAWDSRRFGTPVLYMRSKDGQILTVGKRRTGEGAGAGKSGRVGGQSESPSPEVKPSAAGKTEPENGRPVQPDIGALISEVIQLGLKQGLPNDELERLLITLGSFQGLEAQKLQLRIIDLLKTETVAVNNVLIQLLKTM